MYHALKIKILDLDHIESIVEQDITDVEAEKIVGGTIGVSGSQVVSEKIVGGTIGVIGSQVVSLSKVESVMLGIAPVPNPPHPPMHVVQSINLNLLPDARLRLQITV